MSIKKLSKLKLHHVSERDLAEKQMNSLRGGAKWCTCSCYFESKGGSSSNANMNANYDMAEEGTLVSSEYGCNQYSCRSTDVDKYCPECNEDSGGIWYPM